MDADAFGNWLAGLDTLTAEQRDHLLSVLSGADDEAQVLAALESLVGAERRCPLCHTTGSYGHGVDESGLRRYRCRACRKSWNALTGSPLARLRMRGLWLAFAAAMAGKLTVRQTAARCGVANTTAHRWRHRFLAATSTAERGRRLDGIVEADDLLVRHSEKGRRGLSRAPRKRGARTDPDDDKNTAVVFLAARGGGGAAQALTSRKEAPMRGAIEPHLSPDAILVTDSHKTMKTLKKGLRERHKLINASKARVSGPYHLQTVNGLHSRFRRFLAPFHGVASKYLTNYANWFITAAQSPREFLAGAFAGLRQPFSRVPMGAQLDLFPA